MANLTITIADDVLKRARIKALEEGTSVNALLRSYLEAWTGVGDDREAVIEAILESSRKGRSGRGKARFTRDDLHER